MRRKAKITLRLPTAEIPSIQTSIVVYSSPRACRLLSAIRDLVTRPFLIAISRFIAAAFAQDPTGKKRKLIPVRVAECALTGLLAPIVYIDLIGLYQKAADAGNTDAKEALARMPKLVRMSYAGSWTVQAFAMNSLLWSLTATRHYDPNQLRSRLREGEWNFICCLMTIA